MASGDFDIPDEILDKLQSFHQSLEKMQNILHPLLTLNVNSTDLELSPLDRARLHLTCGYALNSLFWMYLNTLGINPKEHGIKTELERYKSFTLRVKEIADKEKAPVLDKGAANRFVRNALWEPKESDTLPSSSSAADQSLNVTPKQERESDNMYDHSKTKKRRI